MSDVAKLLITHLVVIAVMVGTWTGMSAVHAIHTTNTFIATIQLIVWLAGTFLLLGGAFTLMFLPWPWSEPRPGIDDCAAIYRERELRKKK